MSKMRKSCEEEGCLLMKVAETKISPRSQTVVPPAIRTALKVEAGDYIEWHITNQTVVVSKRSG